MWWPLKDYQQIQRQDSAEEPQSCIEFGQKGHWRSWHYRGTLSLERMALFLNDHFGDRAKKFPLMALIQKMSCALKSVRGTELEDNEHKERTGWA